MQLCRLGKAEELEGGREGSSQHRGREHLERHIRKIRRGMDGGKKKKERNIQHGLTQRFSV